MLRSLAALLLLAAVPAAAERPPVVAYGPGEGLAHENVRSLTQDDHGLLWVGTALGLSRFDGAELATYGPEEGLPATFVHALLATPGGLWVGTARGLYRFDTGPRGPRDLRAPRFVRQRLGAGDEDVFSLSRRRAGGLWVGTDTALWIVEPGRPARRVLAPRTLAAGALATGTGVRAVREGADGTLWVGGDFGLLAGRDGSRTWRPVPVGGPARVLALALDGGDALWIGLDRGLVRRGLGGNAAALQRVAAVGEAPVRALHRAADGRLWAGAVGGVHVLAGGRWRTWTVANGLPDETVNAFLEDRRGDLWLGTDLGGLIKWSAEGFVSYDRDDGLGYASSAAFFTGAAGELYVTSAQRAFVQRFDGDDVDGGRFTAVQLALPAPAARAARREHAPLLLDRAGAWWVGTSRGLFRFPAAGRIEELAGRQPEAVFTRRDGLPAAPIHGLFEDRRGDVWMATRAPGTLAVWRRSRDAVEVVRPAVAPPAAHPTVFAEAGGALWIGWSDGSLLTERRGTFARRASAPAAVSDLYTDPRGRLWVGTAGRGLHAWHPGGAHGGGRLSAVRAGPLRHASVRTVVADAAGRLHVGTTGGVFRHDPDDSSTRALGRTAGLPLGEVLAASRDRHGLWFATLGGVSRLAAGAVPRSPAPAPRAWIGRVAVDGEPWFEAPAGSARIGELRIEPFHRQLRVDLLASLGAAGAPRFQVRLDGRGPWSEASAERSVLLANLPPGSHRLAVRAVDGAGRAGAPTELRFEVIPPLWRRPWFLVLAAALVAAALLAVHRVRLERALALERVRTRIASDLHDEIGSSLARVSVLSEVARRQLASAPEASAGLLAEIGATARELIGVTGDIALSIDPRRSSLASLLARLRRFASDLLEGSGVGLVLEHRGEDPEAVELSPEQRRHLLAALQEMLHNVLRHAGASRVTISVASGPRSLEITVADDGCGLASAPGDPTPGDGQGLANVAARAAALGGRAHLDSTPGRGARWRLDIPRRVPRRGEHDRASVRWPPPW